MAGKPTWFPKGFAKVFESFTYVYPTTADTVRPGGLFDVIVPSARVQEILDAVVAATGR